MTERKECSMKRKKKPSVEKNIQRNRRKFFTWIAICRSSYYGYRFSLKKQTWDCLGELQSERT